MPGPLLTEIRIASDPTAWAAAGFSVEGDRCLAGEVRLEFAPGEGGIVDCALSEVRAAGIDGLPTRLGSPPERMSVPEHENRVIEIDHVVVTTPRLERTIECFEGAGIDLRRIREGQTGMGPYRQAFFRLGRPILEVVEAADQADTEPARFWGITFTTGDIEAAAEAMGDRLGQVKDAVQPGRRIATVRNEAGLGLPVALITEPP